ncbi:MAG: hypothetical protein ACXWV1_10390 [Chitinophagaceae bacterium]
MKKINSVFLLLLFALTFISSDSKAIPVIQKNKNENLEWLQNWFTAFELVSKEVFHLPDEPAPLMLFFDKTYVYTTSEISAPGADPIKGPSLLGEKLTWRKHAHHGQLILPDGQKVPVGLMTFAAPLKDGNRKSFFVMAAPPFWDEAGIESAELGMDKLLTGVFLHEFAHTRQMQGIGARVDEIDSTQQFDMPLSDDIVQNYYKKDSAYVKLFRSEVNMFYEAAFASNEKEARSFAAKALALLKKRQAKYFTGKKNIFKELDNIFLSMEGLGQYAAIAWLTHPKAADMPFEKAVSGFRRKGSQWSQEEGLALFLILNRLSKTDWANDIFGKKPKTVTALLERALQRNK